MSQTVFLLSKLNKFHVYERNQLKERSVAEKLKYLLNTWSMLGTTIGKELTDLTKELTESEVRNSTQRELVCKILVKHNKLMKEKIARDQAICSQLQDSINRLKVY